MNTLHITITPEKRKMLKVTMNVFSPKMHLIGSFNFRTKRTQSGYFRATSENKATLGYLMGGLDLLGYESFVEMRRMADDIKNNPNTSKEYTYAPKND